LYCSFPFSKGSLVQATVLGFNLLKATDEGVPVMMKLLFILEKSKNTLIVFSRAWKCQEFEIYLPHLMVLGLQQCNKMEQNYKIYSKKPSVNLLTSVYLPNFTFLQFFTAVNCKNPKTL
jgi:hypothetical protein